MAKQAAITRAVRLLAQAEAAALSDRDLLMRFVSENDQSAFAALVSRHGAMVLGVCRRALSDPHAAEDCCQAVFLLLVQKAGRNRWQASLANWLYTTARNVAHNARLASARRAMRECQAAVPEAVPPVDALSGRELLGVLDEELDKLAPRYREPLVLCCLEGLTRDEAAARLGVPAATLKSQLERGRKKLADALAERGCELGSTLLAATALSLAGAAVPKLLDSILATVAGSPSASVAALAQGVAVNGVIAHMKLVVLAVAVVAALGLGFAAVQSTSGQPPTAEPKQAVQRSDKPAEAAKLPEAAKKNDDVRTVEVSGHVEGPDGKPIAGAKLYAHQPNKFPPMSDDDFVLRQVGVSAADGKFRATYQYPAYAGLGFLIAHAEGFGVDWITLNPVQATNSDLRLRLVKDQPITGRILDTEGKPMAGVTVGVARIYVPDNDRLDDALQPADESDLPRKSMFFPYHEIFGQATTDRDGRYKLTGAGAERLVLLSVVGRRVGQMSPFVITRAGFDPKPLNEEMRKTTMTNLHVTLYGPDAVIVVDAGKTVEGTVQDVGTRERLAGVKVWFPLAFGGSKQTVTDANGRYRLEGLPPQKKYRVYATPPAGSMYLRRSIEAETTSGMAPARIDLELAKGVVVSGQVIDRQTGKGVQAGIRFVPLPDNKYFGAPGYDGYKHDQILESTDGEGRFRITVIPGQSMAMAQVFGRCDEADGQPLNPYRTARPDPDYKYLFKDIGDDQGWIFRSAVGTESIRNENAVKVINLKDDGEARLNLFVEHGRTAKILVQDPDGKPLAGVVASGLTESYPTAFRLKSTEAPTTVYALGPDQPRRLMFLAPERNLGGTALLRGDETEPIIVKLAPLGTVKGRVVTTDGAALTVASVDVVYSGDVGELYRLLGQSIPVAGTDRWGRYTLPGIIPGVRFGIQIRVMFSTYNSLRAGWLEVTPTSIKQRSFWRGLTGGFSPQNPQENDGLSPRLNRQKSLFFNFPRPSLTSARPSFIPVGGLDVEPGQTLDLGDRKVEPE